MHSAHARDGAAHRRVGDIALRVRRGDQRDRFLAAQVDRPQPRIERARAQLAVPQQLQQLLGHPRAHRLVLALARVLEGQIRRGLLDDQPRVVAHFSQRRPDDDRRRRQRVGHSEGAQRGRHRTREVPAARCAGGGTGHLRVRRRLIGQAASARTDEPDR